MGTVDWLGDNMERLSPNLLLYYIVRGGLASICLAGAGKYAWSVPIENSTQFLPLFFLLLAGAVVCPRLHSDEEEKSRRTP